MKLGIEHSNNFVELPIFDDVKLMRNILSSINNGNTHRNFFHAFVIFTSKFFEIGLVLVCYRSAFFNFSQFAAH